MRDTMRNRKPKGKTAPSRADDQQPLLQRSRTNVNVAAMSNSHRDCFDAAFAAAAAAVHNTAPIVDTLPQPKPYRRRRPRAEPHKMQSTMRKIPSKAPMRPSRAAGQALLPIREDLPIRRARSNNPNAFVLTPKSKAHPQLAVTIPQPKELVQSSYEPKPKTYTAPPMPLLKRSETDVHHDSLREHKRDQRNGLAGDGDNAIQTVKGFIQQAKNKRVERKRQRAEKALLSAEQSSSITPTSPQTSPGGSILDSKLLGTTKVQFFKDRVATMLLWHQQRAELKRDMKREAQNSKLKAKISSPFNFAHGGDVKDMPVGLGITLEQTRRAPLIDLPISKGNRARPTRSAVNEDIDNASLVTRFSDIIGLADGPATPVPELPKKVAAKGPTKELKAKEADKGPVLVSLSTLLLPIREHIPALTNPVERADNHKDEVPGRAGWKTDTGYRGIDDWIRKGGPPSPSIYSTRGSRLSSTWGSPQIPQEEIDNLIALPKTVSEPRDGKNVESYLSFRTARKGHTKAKETPELMNMDKVGSIGDGDDDVRAVGRNTAFYDFYDDILTDN